MSHPRFHFQTAKRFSRSWWFEQARNFAWVAVVTILIWIYADMEFTEAKDFTTTIHFEAAPNSRLALLSQNDIEVTFRARGNRGSLEKFENLKKAKGNRLEIDLSAFKPGDNTVPVEELLAKDDDFVKSGLSMVSSTPGLVEFRLDKLITVKNVRVDVDYTGATLAHPPVVTPNTMSIDVPRSRWEQVHPDPVLKTEPVNLQKIDTDKPFTLELVPSIGGITVQPQQPTVKVEVQVKKLTEQTTLWINVRVVEPVTWFDPKDSPWKEYEFVRKDPMEWRRQIAVTGPKQDLEALKAREQEVTAFVTLTDEDKKPVSWNNRPVTVCFPPDLQVKLAPGENPTVQFKLVPIH